MKVKKGSITYYLLLALEKSAEGFVVLNSFSYSAQMRALKGIPENTKKPAFIESIRRLRQKGLIEHEANKEGETILRLTTLGRDFLGKDEVWDGKYRIIIWDIPESKKIIRNLFRRRLKGWGFKNWQRSVWVSKKNVTAKLIKLIKELELEDQIGMIECDSASVFNIKLFDRTS